MPENALIEQIVERVVSEVLNGYLPQMRGELTRRVLQEVQPHLGVASESNNSTANNAPDLLKSVAEIHAGTTQREILRALLDNAALYTGRAALFVIKANTATGWQGRAFANSDDIKDFSLDINGGIGARVMQSRTASRGNSAEMDPQFVSRFGNSSDQRVFLLPLLLKEKVAALIYADAGSDGTIDAPALELLVVAAGAWLEVVALRKSGKEAEINTAEKAPSAPPVSAPAYNDPFAAHSPAYAAPAPVAAPAPYVPPAVAAPQFSAPVATAVAAAHDGTAAAPATDSFANLSPEDADVHRKAQRFARLLVDEIKLYNQAKVTEGRKGRDLYDRLREDIDKSHATYKKRFGATVAASASYFNREVVRSLAEDDISLMGSNFQR